jgi:hypothetical protein
MQAGKADKQPPRTQLVTLLMQTPQLYARNAARTSVNCDTNLNFMSPGDFHYNIRLSWFLQHMRSVNLATTSLT